MQEWYFEVPRFLGFENEWGFYRLEGDGPLEERTRTTMALEAAHAWVETQWRDRAILHYSMWMDKVKSHDDAYYAREEACKLEDEARQHGLYFVADELAGGYILSPLDDNTIEHTLAEHTARFERIDARLERHGEMLRQILARLPEPGQP